jgi:hypothetical protein
VWVSLASVQTDVVSIVWSPITMTSPKFDSVTSSLFFTLWDFPFPPYLDFTHTPKQGLIIGDPTQAGLFFENTYRRDLLQT